MSAHSAERRKYERKKVDGSLIMYNEKMYAEIIDISKGGLLCKCRVRPKKMFSPVFDVEILDRDSGKFVKGLSGVLIRCDELQAQDVDAPEVVLDFGIEFKNMTEEKENLLDQFITSRLSTH